MTENLILLAVFTAVLLATFSIFTVVAQRRDVERNIESSNKSKRARANDALLATGNEKLRYYLDVVANQGPNSVRMRLVRAGYYDKSAVLRFNLIRFVSVAVVFTVMQVGLPQVLPTLSRNLTLILSLCLAGIAFIGCSFVLEKMGNKRLREYRKIFPDLLDLLLVCVDSGLSIDAAFDRVTREFLNTVPDFGMQLSIVNLEIRAGRPMHEALYNLSDRIAVEEARNLAILFRQSEELGSSVSKTLRTFANEMRQLRIIKAEEKANTLPVRMLFPMAFFMFPVSLIIVLVPIMISLISLLQQMAPG
ncbi:type II secretion system F family protein [Thalassovita mangrovi]|uniref:Type II secretion system F family protein n=1 Tax=Thalassovita mangrovi TaxID=2692236 RepID=A0A6L8LHP3_9RHOB|nr:type II secretion system F family protein [Thalassovita mangrovi]